jgi:putative FmdB family regulatory protein
MPTYDYVCNTCGKQFEVFQSMSADVLTHCPVSECGETEKGLGEVTRKIGGGAGLIFSGSGFYITDYKSGSSSGGNTTDKSASSESSSSSSGTQSATSPAPSSSPASSGSSSGTSSSGNG